MTHETKDGTKIEATHFVVGCIDHRCTDDLQSVMSQIVDPEGKDPYAWDRWDHVALPGASIGVVQSVFPSWREAFTIQLSIALDLHPYIHTVVVVDHMECGAYRRLHPGYDDDQRAAHQRFTQEFKGLIKALHPRLNVQRFLLEPCPEQRKESNLLDWQAHDLDNDGVVICRKH
jgi:hypothetical protein